MAVTNKPKARKSVKAAPPPVAPAPVPPPVIAPPAAPKGAVMFTHDQMDDIIAKLGEAEKMFLGALPIAALPMITRIRDMFKERRKGL